MTLPTFEWSSSIHTIQYWLLAILTGIGMIIILTSTLKEPKKIEEAPAVIVPHPTRYEQIQVDVLNVDYDIELVMPDGTIQSKEPFVVKRMPGKPLPITIRHQGLEQQIHH